MLLHSFPIASFLQTVPFAEKSVVRVFQVLPAVMQNSRMQAKFTGDDFDFSQRGRCVKASCRVQIVGRFRFRFGSDFRSSRITELRGR